jgi:hypothetical protein
MLTVGWKLFFVSNAKEILLEVRDESHRCRKGVSLIRTSVSIAKLQPIIEINASRPNAAQHMEVCAGTQLHTACPIHHNSRLMILCQHFYRYLYKLSLNTLSYYIVQLLVSIADIILLS